MSARPRDGPPMHFTKEARRAAPYANTFRHRFGSSRNGRPRHDDRCRLGRPNIRKPEYLKQHLVHLSCVISLAHSPIHPPGSWERRDPGRRGRGGLDSRWRGMRVGRVVCAERCHVVFLSLTLQFTRLLSK